MRGPDAGQRRRDAAGGGGQGGAVQVDPGFSQLTPRLLSSVATKMCRIALKPRFQLQPAPLRQGQPGGRVRGRAGCQPQGGAAGAHLTLVHFPAELYLHFLFDFLRGFVG